jgi:hypothetical protein
MKKKTKFNKYCVYSLTEMEIIFLWIGYEALSGSFTEIITEDYRFKISNN